MADKTSLGDRMKGYEAVEAQRRAMPRLPLMIRLDGKCFSRWTRGLRRPFDPRLTALMVEVTRRLVEETGACIGYTQSDEISLVCYTADPKSQLYCDGRVQKLTSVLASMTTAWFNALVPEHLPERAGRLALFDARVWNVPTREEAANTLLWRERDATKNSISMAAREHHSHRELHGRTGNEMQHLLWQKGINWNDFPACFKRGTFVQRRTVRRAFTVEELDRLPPKHEAHTNPGLVVERREIAVLEMPPFDKVTNRVEVVFDGAEPELDAAWVDSAQQCEVTPR